MTFPGIRSHCGSQVQVQVQVQVLASVPPTRVRVSSCTVSSAQPDKKAVSTSMPTHPTLPNMQVGSPALHLTSTLTTLISYFLLTVPARRHECWDMGFAHICSPNVDYNPLILNLYVTTSAQRTLRRRAPCWGLISFHCFYLRIHVRMRTPLRQAATSPRARD